MYVNTTFILSFFIELRRSDGMRPQTTSAKLF